MARSSFVARMVFKKCLPCWPNTSNVQQAPPHSSATFMKRFLTKSWGHGTFKLRPNSFGACIVSSDRGHGNVKVKNIRNVNTFWTSDQNNIRNLNTFRAPDRCAIEKPKWFRYLLIIQSTKTYGIWILFARRIDVRLNNLRNFNTFWSSDEKT